MKYRTIKQKRQRRQNIIWGTVIAVLLTPIVLALIFGAALSLAGCGDPNIICTIGA